MSQQNVISQYTPLHLELFYNTSVPSRGKSVRDSDAEVRERARFALIGNAVTVQVWWGWHGTKP